MYDPLSHRLISEDFKLKGGRFEKVIGSKTLYLDFLTERPSGTAPTAAQVDDVTVSAFFGVDRALQIYREVLIEGRDLSGGKVRETVKVCEVGPFLCLKLQAYAKRAEPKDVFDAVRTVLAYDAGVAAAAAAFRNEASANLAYPVAKQVLEARFANEQEKGPTAYANFCCEGLETGNREDVDFRLSELAADAVTVARHLLTLRN